MGFFSGITDFIGNAWDSVTEIPGKIISGLSGAVSDVGGKYLESKVIDQPASALAWSQSKEAADTAWARSKEASALQFDREYGAYKNRYQDVAKDMAKAGLNPILAASGGFNVGSGPNAAMPHVPQAQGYQPQSPTGISSASSLNLAQRKKVDAETAKTQQETKKIVQEMQFILSQIAKSDTETGRIAQETLNLIVQHNKIIAEIRQINARADTEEIAAKSAKLLEGSLDLSQKGWQQLQKITVEDIKEGLEENVMPIIKGLKQGVIYKIQEAKDFINNFKSQFGGKK